MSVLLVSCDVRLFLHRDEVGVRARVEPVDVLHEESVPVLDVDTQQTLLGEGVLGKPEVVQVAAGDGGDVVAVVAVVGECRADVQHIAVAPTVVSGEKKQRKSKNKSY